MSKPILTVISELKRMLHLSPATKMDVQKAEFDLGLSFSEEFKEYVLAYGVITAYRVEITGICSSKRLNVVDVTKAEREMNPYIPMDMYVIESTGYEGVIILQNAQGEIFSLVPHGVPKKIFESLADYLIDLQRE